MAFIKKVGKTGGGGGLVRGRNKDFTLKCKL